MTFNRILLAVPAALLLAACGGSDGPAGPGENPTNAGTFSATVAGGLAKSVTGTAAFGTSEEDGFTLGLGDEDNGFIFGRDLGVTPGVGTYNVWDLTDDDEEEGEDGIPEAAIQGVFGLDVAGTAYICYSTGGTITISTSTATRLAGSLNVTADCWDGQAEVPKSITVVGPFNAVGGAVD